MIKSKLATVLLAGTIFTGGVLTALTWTGGTSLTEAQQIASNFNNKAVEYITKAKELEALAQNQNTDINKLVAKIGELNTLKTELETEVKRLEALVNEGAGNEAEAQRLEAELNKANTELTKANAEAEAHKTAIENTLDASIFESLTVPERIDITEALGDSAEEEEAQLKYSYEIDVTTNLQSSQQAEGKAKAEAEIIPYIESMTLLDNPELIKAVKITVRNSSREYRYNVTIYTDSNNQSTLDSKINNYRSEALSTYKIDNLNTSVRN